MMARWCYLLIALLLSDARAFSANPNSDNNLRLPINKKSTFAYVTLRSLAPHHNEALCHTSQENLQQEQDQIRQLLVGKHKWLGGAISDSGTIYGIPSHSNHVICLSPSIQNADDDSSYQINMLRLPSYITNNAKRDGGKHKDHHFKWLRGIISDNYLYGIPAWSKDGVLKVNIDEWSKWREANPSRRIIDGNEELSNKLVTTIPFPDANDVEQQHYRWAWHGAALNQNSTAIYCIPSNAQHVLKVDLETSTTCYLSIPPLPEMDPSQHIKLLAGSNKWYGGILGNDNCVYGIPYAAGSVLCIDANTDQVSLLGDFGWNKYNFHGGIKSSKGAIYAFPAHADEVLKIDTTVAKNGDEKLSLLPIQRASYDNDPVTRYKWLGGSIGQDGNIYGMPSDASSVLHINVMNDVVTTFGCIQDSDPDRVNADGSKYIEKNKFQGGVLGRDGFIYALPSNAKGILRIDTRPVSDEEGKVNFLDKNRVSCIGSLEQKTDKWQGGFAVKSGEIIAVPENCNSVLKVLPPTLQDADRFIVEGLADGGVIISTL